MTYSMMCISHLFNYMYDSILSISQLFNYDLQHDVHKSLF